MKHFLVTILAFIYITSSTGVMYHMHYCMGQVAGWGLGQNTSGTCSKCGMEKSNKKDNGCCKDEHKFLKTSTDQKTVDASFNLAQQMGVSLPVSNFELVSTEIPSITEGNPISNSPPRHSNVAVYISNCTFLI